MGKTKYRDSKNKAKVNESKRISHNVGDTLHTTEDVYYNEDEEEEDSSIEEDPSASDIPDSVEFKSVHSDKLVDRARQLTWSWKTLTPSFTFKSKSGSNNERSIQGDTVIIFGKPRRIDRTGQYPIDGKEENVYSSKVAVGPYSFLDSNSKYEKNAPPPLHINYEVLNKPKPTKKSKILKSFEVNHENLLECTDK